MRSCPLCWLPLALNRGLSSSSYLTLPPKDVCAGIAIAEEAGGRCFGGKQSTLSGDDEMNAALVCGRKYFVIRGLPEGGREAQAKLAREFYEYIEEWDQ